MWCLFYVPTSNKVRFDLQLLISTETFEQTFQELVDTVGPVEKLHKCEVDHEDEDTGCQDHERYEDCVTYVPQNKDAPDKVLTEDFTYGTGCRHDIPCSFFIKKLNSLIEIVQFRKTLNEGEIYQGFLLVKSYNLNFEERENGVLRYNQYKVIYMFIWTHQYKQMITLGTG